MSTAKAPTPIASEPAPAPSKPAPAPAKPAEQIVPKSALELRAARRRILQRRFGLWVGLPTLLAIVYYLFVAVPQYDSTLLIAVESSEGRIADAQGKAPNAGNQRDARLLREALRSGAGLAVLDEGEAFRTHYREHGDWLTRLSGDSGSDETLAYYRDKIVVTHEAGTNLTKVRVRAFSGEVAHGFATRLVEFARQWVEKQNATSSAARLAQAQDDVTRERALFAAAAAALAKLEQPKPTDPASIDYKIAEKRLEAALEGFQLAEMEVGRAQRYLVILDGPSQPDRASVPRRAWGILTVAIGALVLVSVLSLLGASVREHAKF